MLTETGRVVAIEDDGLWVETLKQSVCSQCSAQHGCGQKLLANVSPKSNMTFIKAFFTQQSPAEVWAVGDQAVLGIEENALVVAALIAYGIPLVLLILGMLLGASSGFSLSVELNAALGALFGLSLGAVFVKYHARLTKSQLYFQAQVLGRGSLFIHS